MAYTFRDAHPARGNSRLQLSSQRSAGCAASPLGRIRPVPSIVAHHRQHPARARAELSNSSTFCPHTSPRHAGTSPAAAACRAGSRRGCHSVARQPASRPNASLRREQYFSSQHSALSRHSSTCCSFTATSSQEAETTTAFQAPPTYVTANGRIIAIGDIHGDLQKTITSLKVAGVLEEDRMGRPLWCGNDTVVVQLGDVLDRGDCEIGRERRGITSVWVRWGSSCSINGSILLLRELDRQARMQGGAVYMLNGNHESLNVAGNFRYVTPGGFRESALAAGLSKDALDSMESKVRARMRLYRPGGQMACELAKNPTVLIVNDSVFAHGGVLSQHVNYGLEKLNEEVSAWMMGLTMEDGTKRRPPFLAMGSSQSVMWNRDFGQEKFTTLQQRMKACMDVEGMLRLLGARQLIIGHTPQTIGANCECNGRVWRMDVGMSKGVLNAKPQVLEIEPADASGNTKVRVLSPPMQSLLPPPPAMGALCSHYPI